MQKPELNRQRWLCNCWHQLRLLAGQEDKQQHFWCSFIIQLLATLPAGWWLALIITVLIGLTKEVWDHYYGSGFCWWDMLANGLGIGAGLIIYGCIRIAG